MLTYINKQQCRFSAAIIIVHNKSPLPLTVLRDAVPRTHRAGHKLSTVSIINLWPMMVNCLPHWPST